MARYRQVRATTEQLCAPLAPDDFQIQSIPQTSPPKWHLAHVSWFFENFVLPLFSNYRPYHPLFGHLFNSYYQSVGEPFPRPDRGLLSRPTVGEIYGYRRYVDEQMLALLTAVSNDRWPELQNRVVLGLNHEQQHQELLLMDIKHNLSISPLFPAYRDDLPQNGIAATEMGWQEQHGGLYEIGAAGGEFAFDNETPRHRVLVNDHRLADRFVTNGEYLAFIEDGGYRDARLWLADGWALINQRGWQQPLYWRQRDGEWREFTLAGIRSLNPAEPVCHLSYYEADAYACWAGKRLPREEELELALTQRPLSGNFVESDRLHPAPASSDGQWFGDLWAWTASSYGAYPGFRPLAGSLGEYNGKFMANQMVLKGGSCATPQQHCRASYRNFFYPDERWAFCGLRLAEDL
ncbi:ergothioneine biosynthesis protein EgtB [Marinobacterium sp. CAU 1594]|nr:ergothioneine biosynthesis protein EgtB [Marinobacterium arenosum]